MLKLDILLSKKGKIMIRNSGILHWYVYGFYFLGAVVLLGGAIIGNKLIFEKIPTWYTYMLIAISCPWPLVSCIFVVHYKELPRFGLPSIKGKAALIQGMIGIIALLTLEVLALYNLLIEFFLVPHF